MNEFPLPRFNPRPQIQTLALGPGQAAYVVDDALLNPEQMVELACQARAQFVRPQGNAYPGLELWMPPPFTAAIDDFFRLHVRRLVGGRRSLSLKCRFSMTTFAPQELQPPQWICHRDGIDLDDGRVLVASVLYLFHDSSHGGTSFYRGRKTAGETEALVADSYHLDAAAFNARWGISAGYMRGDDEYFERIGGAPARWNRMVFYDGTVFHSGDIGTPQALNDDPRAGRLTLNTFFVCQRAAS